MSLSRVWLFATPWTIQSMEFSRPQYWSGEPFLSPGDLPNSGIKPRSCTLQADSLPAKPPGKPKNMEWVAYPFSSGSSWPKNWTEVSCIASGFFTCWATREVHINQPCFCFLKKERKEKKRKSPMMMWHLNRSVNLVVKSCSHPKNIPGRGDRKCWSLGQ